MRESKSIYVSVLLVSLSLILSSCSKYKEPAPFFDGLFLEYTQEYKSIRSKIAFNVEALDDHRFKMIRSIEPMLIGDKIEEMFVDEYGIVYESNIKRHEGKFSSIWIPVQKMKIGDTFDGRHAVIRKDRWRKWGVLVVEDTPTQALDYYDLNTGFRVGTFAKTPKGPVEEFLVKTNANIQIENVE